MKITLLQLHEAYSRGGFLTGASINKKDEWSVWLIPGGLSGDGDIDDELAKKGVCFSQRVSSDRASREVAEIEAKFIAAGFTVEHEALSND